MAPPSGSSPQLLIIDPSIHFAEDVAAAKVREGWLGEVRILYPALNPRDGPTPGTGYDVSGIAVLGSRASAKDDLPWLAALSAWLRPILQGAVRVPLLGICFGHQLIAHCAGANIGSVRQDKGKLLGLAETRILRSRLLPEGRLRVVVSHGEEVKNLPAGYHKSADREGILFDGLEHDQLPIFTFQFHPEAGESFLLRRKVPHTAADLAQIDHDSQRLLSAFHRVALGSQPS